MSRRAACFAALIVAMIVATPAAASASPAESARPASPAPCFWRAAHVSGAYLGLVGPWSGRMCNYLWQGMESWHLVVGPNVHVHPKGPVRAKWQLLDSGSHSSLHVTLEIRSVTKREATALTSTLLRQIARHCTHGTRCSILWRRIVAKKGPHENPSSHGKGQPTTVTGPLRWSAPKLVDQNSSGPSGKGLSNISCPSVSFCAAVDMNNQVLTFNGSSWSAPQEIDPQGPGFAQISCPSASFCVAADSGGQTFSFNGQSWTAAENGDSNGIASISCPSTSLCWAADGNGDTIMWAGNMGLNGAILWVNGPRVTPITGSVGQITCASPTFCMGYDVQSSPPGRAAEQSFTINGPWDNYTTSQPQPIDPNVVDVSCASPSFCAEAGSNGEVATFNGTSWSTPQNVDPNGAFNAISCPTASFCAAAGADGKVVVFNGTSWSKPQTLADGGLQSISCPTPSLCMASDFSGDVLEGRRG